MAPPSTAELGSRALFPDLEPRAYLNHAAIAPPSVAVARAIDGALEVYARLGLGAYMGAVEQRARLKDKLAVLVGCDAADLALTVSTTRALIDLATCIPWKDGDRIVCFDREFPANVTPWQQVRPVTLLPQEGLDDAAVLAGLEAELGKGGVRLVAVSAVQFSTGRAMPVAEITRLAHEHGAEVSVDAIQALGVMPFDARALGIDYLAGGAHKWLMGLEGVGFLYARDPTRLVPRTAGWLSHVDPLGFLIHGPGHLRHDRPIRESIDFMEGHSINALGCYGLEAAVDLILQLGVPTIQKHVQRYNDALEVGLVERGFESLRPKGSPSGTLSVLPPQDTRCVDWMQHFAANGVSISGPDGKLRFSPQWPNHLDEVDAVLGVADAFPG